MKTGLILISHERLRELTVKTVYPLDAVLAGPSYISTLTNKEAAFAKFPYTRSATDTPGSSVMPFSWGYGTVSHRFILFMFYVLRYLCPTKGPFIDSGRLEW